MRVTTKITWDIETGEVLHRESYEYSGPVDFFCGGPSKEQRSAAASQANLNNQVSSQYSANQAKVNPYATDLMENGIGYFGDIEKNGLPFFNAETAYGTSNLARNVNKAKAGMRSRFAGYGTALPSGFAESSMRDLDATAARAFDERQLGLIDANQQAKADAARTQATARMSGAQLLNPAQYAQLATSGNNSIFQAPLQNHFWGDLINGVVQGGARVASSHAEAANPRLTA